MFRIAVPFLWFCADDHIAALVNQPAVGNVPWWVVLIVGIAAWLVA